MYKFIKKNKKFSRKFYFDGKSYKLSIKKNIYFFRFNRVNRTILFVNNLNLFTKGLRKKIYIYNIYNNKNNKKIQKIIFSIRKYNTYTLRGIYMNINVLNKRTGRVSEYV